MGVWPNFVTWACGREAVAGMDRRAAKRSWTGVASGCVVSMDVVRWRGVRHEAEDEAGDAGATTPRT